MIARGERARVLQRRAWCSTGCRTSRRGPQVVDDPSKLLDTGTLIIATKAIDSAAASTRSSTCGSRTRSRCRTACSRTSCWRAVFGFSRVLGAMADFSGELLGQWRSEVHAQCLPAPGRGEGRHEPARRSTGRAHRRRRRALRGGFQHPHARVVEVRRLDRAVSARGAHAADHLEIPHGRTQRHGHRAHRARGRAARRGA